jgi:two-component system sensor histidine kinase ChiS
MMPSGTARPRSRRPRILVVDDDPLIRGIVRAMLDAGSYELDEAASGAEALRLIEERAPRVVLLDIMMPGMSGYEVCRAIRRRTAAEETTVVMLSALDSLDARREGFSSGADLYLTKPFSPLELLETLSQAVAGTLAAGSQAG